MDLNDLQLSNWQLTDFYKNSLVELSNIEVNEPETVKSEKDWKYLGDNNRNILIMVDYKEAVYLPDDHLVFLSSILSACKIGLDDVVILNLKGHNNVNYKELISYFNSTIAFLFAVEPEVLGLPIQFPPFQVQLFNKCTYLLSPSLEELKADKILKSKLWLCLQRIFSN